MRTECPVCSLEYVGEHCPNQWRLYKAPLRREALLEFTREWHEAAGVSVRAHRAAMARLAQEVTAKA